MWSRNNYAGTRRRLVIAFDVGTTYSGISYSILDPGRVPKVEGVTRFPKYRDNASDVVSLSKVPSILYYDAEGNLKAAGAETLPEDVKDTAYREQWTKVEWFKLHLRPKQMKEKGEDDDAIPPLPPNKQIEDVFADYLRYLNECALRFIEYAHGAEMWESLSSHLSPTIDENGRYTRGEGIVYILSHPNGWEGYHQQIYSNSAVKGGLLPDNLDSLQERLHFVTEGEASLHWAYQTLGSNATMKKGTGFTVIDAGGGTIDVSSYRRKKKESQERGSFDELAPPNCQSCCAYPRVMLTEVFRSGYFQGSVFVTVRARLLLKSELESFSFDFFVVLANLDQQLPGLLIDSEYLDDIDDILEAFDDTTKLRFRDPQDPQYVRFGGVGDNDTSVNIRFGQLKLKGNDVAELFDPAITCIRDAVAEQRKLASKPISHVILVGGFVANDYLFERVKSSLSSISVQVHRLENTPNKAVANGAVSFYLDHFVTARLSKVAYGIFGRIDYKPNDRAHRKLAARHGVVKYLDSDKKMLNDVFIEYLPKGMQISEFKECRKTFYGHSDTNFSGGKEIVMHVWSYIGKNTKYRIWGEEREMYSHAFTVVVDASHVPTTKSVVDGVTYDHLLVDLVLYFGMTSIKADMAWKEDGIQKRSAAKIIYTYPWSDDMLSTPSRQPFFVNNWTAKEMQVAEAFETPHPTALTREQAYRLPSSKPQAALTPNSAGHLTTNSQERSEGRDLRIPSTLSSFTLASSPRNMEEKAHSFTGIRKQPQNSGSPPPRERGTSRLGAVITDDVAPPKRKLKDRMKSRSAAKSKSRNGGSSQNDNFAHISTATAQFQSLLKARGRLSTNTGSLTLASPFISRASSPVDDAGSEAGGQSNAQPMSGAPKLREKVFDPNRPMQPPQKTWISQSQNGSPRSTMPSQDSLRKENVLPLSRRQGREKYFDYQSPLLSSPRKKDSVVRERRPSAPSRLLTKRDKGSRGTSMKGKAEKSFTSCPTSPSKPSSSSKNETLMGPPSHIPSHSEHASVGRTQTPLSDASRQPFFESDLDSDLEFPKWLRSGMGIGSVDFNRPPSQMSWFGFSHSGEEVDEWIESEDDEDNRLRSSREIQGHFRVIDADLPAGGIFGEDVRGISTPSTKPGRGGIPFTDLQAAAIDSLPQDKKSDSSCGEMDMELSEVVGHHQPALLLPANSSRTLSDDDSSNTSQLTTQLISSDDIDTISWITDSIVSPPTIYLERGMKKGAGKPSGKRGSTPDRDAGPTDGMEPVAEGREENNGGQGEERQATMPMLDLRALQGNSTRKVLSSQPNRTLLRTQSLPVTVNADTVPKPGLAAATKRTRSGTIVPADTASIPAAPHLLVHADNGESASLAESGSFVGRTRSGTVVRSNSGNLSAVSAQEDNHTYSASAVPLSMTRRTRSGTIQAFTQPNLSGRRSRSGSVTSDPARTVHSQDSEDEFEPLFEQDTGRELDMVGIEEEGEMAFAPPDLEQAFPMQRYAPTRSSSVDGHLGTCTLEGSSDDVPSPFVDDAYVPQHISSPDQIDFLSSHSSRIDELVKMEIGAVDSVVQGSWNAALDGDEDIPGGGPALLWCVADPPSPEVTLRPRRQGRFINGNPTKTPVRRRGRSGKRPVPRKARFEGFEEEIHYALHDQRTTERPSNDEVEGVGFSDDEFDFLLHPSPT
ncbi:hypothetical protein CVT24_010806 [Panaeolus cyanescens]|uniref:Uncharacterized protein n=1 Tax=Panaeolus cyanescens TaxID=181874 RepID=A0A409VGZ9_9AGAR|nr:hypothetical protein CVT24_010806 [Panaeolus cyanescens]